MTPPNKEIMQIILDHVKERNVVIASIVKGDEVISLGWNRVNELKDASARPKFLDAIG